MNFIFAIKISLLLWVVPFTSTNFVFAKTSLARLDHQPGGRGGGSTSLYIYIYIYIYKPYMYVPPRRVRFLRCFGPKRGIIHFTHFWSGIGLRFRGNYGSV